MSRLLLRSVLMLALAAAVALAGCSKRTKFYIESNACWSGLVNGNIGISGCGNANYTVTGRLDCVQVTRTTATGTLRLRIGSQPWADTPAGQTSIEVCQ